MHVELCWPVALCAVLSSTSASAPILADDSDRTLWKADRHDNRRGAVPQSARARGHPSRHVLVRGLYNTGTNVLSTLIEANLAVHVLTPGWQPPDPAPYGCYKHTQLRLISPTVVDPPSVQGAWVSVITVRHPVKWLASMRKARYGMRCADWCNLTTCEDRLLLQYTQWHPCAMPSVTLEYAQLEDSWVDWVSALERLQVPHVVVRYEDVILRPFSVLQSIASAANTSFKPGHSTPATLRLVKNSAKSHGSPAGLAVKRDELERTQLQDLLVNDSIHAALCLPKLQSRLLNGALAVSNGLGNRSGLPELDAARGGRAALDEPIELEWEQGRAIAAEATKRIFARLAKKRALQSWCHAFGYVCISDS